MTNDPIKTYDGVAFREKFIRKKPELDEILRPDYARFFVVKVEDMIRLMRLPVPPTRSLGNTIIYLTEGEAIMHIGSERYRIVAHECLIVPAGEVFSFDNIDLNHGYLCAFQSEFLVGKFAGRELIQEFEFLSHWGNRCIQLPADVSGYVEQLFRRLLAEYMTSGLANPDIIQPYFIALLCELNRAYKPLSGTRQGSAVTITNRFKALLMTHFRTRHLVSDYASMLSITPNHLNKTVKAITGKSPTRWIDEAIVLEAKVLLANSPLTVSQVAAEVGLFDASYFTRMFRKYEGTTPLQYRQWIGKS